MNELTGFEAPRTAKDDYALNLWRKHGLGDSPSLAQIEPVAKLLFTEGKILESTAIVLGRRIDAKEGVVRLLIFDDAKETFAFLLTQLAIEKSAKNS